MLKGLVRLGACAASGAAFLALTGCGGGQPDDGYAGPPPAGYDRGSTPPVLMGSTPPPARPSTEAGLAGGPGYGVMSPIPNPADLTKAERVPYYGHKYDYLPDPKGRRVGAPAAAPAYPLIVRRRADGTLEVSMRPIANPEDMSAAERRRVYGNRYAPRPSTGWSPRRIWRAEPAPKPAAAAAKAAPVARPAAKPAASVKPVAAAPAPAPKAAVAAAAPVAKPAVAPAMPAPTKAEQLSAAVRPEVMKGAVLTVPEGLAKGEESKVSLALPANLLDIIKREAGKLGLAKAARKAEVSATLTGQGYEITPNGAQTQPVTAGEAARFDWNVKPGAGDKAPLKATVDGTLVGDKKAKTTFSLASLEQAVAPVVEDAKAAAKGFRFPSLSLKSLSVPGMKPLNVPGLGKVESEKLVGAGLALLALLLVIGMARNASASRARAERRRKFRTMTENSHDAAHETVSQPYVNPMIAAAGGVAAGAAVAHAAHDDHHGHDDHGHGHDAHGHHDDHGHGGHHDHHAGDHGHAHDAHGHDAHPVAHAPAAHHDDHGHGHDAHGHGHGHDDHGHDDHGHGGHGHDDHGHGHDDHGHGHDAHPVSHAPAAHHDDHGHGHDAHGHEAHGHDDHGHGHGDHGHGEHGHDDHGHAHDDHGHGAHHVSHTPAAHHDDHGHGHDAHGHDAHGHDDHGHDDHAHGHDAHAHDAHGHDHHHREHEHA